MPTSDDFHDAKKKWFWSFEDPAGDCSHSFVGQGGSSAALRLAIPSGTSHDLWTGIDKAPKFVQDHDGSACTVETRIITTLNSTFQAAGIIFKLEEGNIVRFDWLFGGSPGLRVFGGKIIDGTATTLFDINVTDVGNPYYLRVSQDGMGEYIVNYSTNGTSWTEAGAPVVSGNVQQIGLHAITAGGSPPALNADFDYFFDNSAVISPEDHLQPARVRGFGIPTHPHRPFKGGWN